METMVILEFLFWSVFILPIGSAVSIHDTSHGYGSEDFQNCWIHIYRNSEEDWNYMALNYPISLPVAKIYDGVEMDAKYIWSNYVTVHKYLACSAYFLVFPKRWKIESMHMDVFLYPDLVCAYLYDKWPTLAPFRDGVDFLVVLHDSMNGCSLISRGSESLRLTSNLMIIITDSSLPIYMDTAKYFTYQYPELANNKCKSSLYLKSCLLEALSEYAGSGDQIVFDPPIPTYPARQFQENTCGHYYCSNGFWIKPKQNCTMVTKLVTGMRNPFHIKEDLKIKPWYKTKMKLSLQVFEIWVPTEYGDNNTFLQVVRDMLLHTIFPSYPDVESTR